MSRLYDPEWADPRKLAEANRAAAERARRDGDLRRAYEHDDIATQLEQLVDERERRVSA